MISFTKPRARLMALALISVAACGKKDEVIAVPPQAAATAPAAPVAAVITPNPTAKVTLLEMGRRLGANKRVIDSTSNFKEGDTIYIAIVSEGTPVGGTLAIRWVLPTGKVVDSTMQNVESTDPASKPSVVTNFRSLTPKPLAEGRYRLDVLLNGLPVGSQYVLVSK